MVASTIELPNIRRFFVPGRGKIIADADLSGADAQVVAWEAGDEDLKSAFRAGLKVHLKNARDIFPQKVRGWSDEAIKDTDRPGGVYHDCKRAVHASNYGARPRTIAITLGWTVAEAESFQRTWFGLHPGIRDWHNRVENQLQGIQCWRCNSFEIEGKTCRDCGAKAGRTVGNKFGYRRVYFDRIEGLLAEALAWVPQSTVAIVCARGATLLDQKLPWCDILLQVHDSLVFQYPVEQHSSRSLIRDALTVPVPYSDPLTIPWGLAISRKSWGDVEGCPWE